MLSQTSARENDFLRKPLRARGQSQDLGRRESVDGPGAQLRLIGVARNDLVPQCRRAVGGTHDAQADVDGRPDELCPGLRR